MAYSPELNPAEHIWKIIKFGMQNQVMKTMYELSDKISSVINHSLTVENTKSITGFKLCQNLFED